MRLKASWKVIQAPKERKEVSDSSPQFNLYDPAWILKTLRRYENVTLLIQPAPGAFIVVVQIGVAEETYGLRF